MSSPMMLRLDEQTKSKLNRLAHGEGKNVSQVMRELIQNYVSERDLGGYIDDLWLRIGKKFKSRRKLPTQIPQIIRSVRAVGR